MVCYPIVDVNKFRNCFARSVKKTIKLTLTYESHSVCYFSVANLKCNQSLIGLHNTFKLTLYQQRQSGMILLQDIASEGIPVPNAVNLCYDIALKLARTKRFSMDCVVGFYSSCVTEIRDYVNNMEGMSIYHLLFNCLIGTLQAVF